jgi:hypothetical protein
VSEGRVLVLLVLAAVIAGIVAGTWLFAQLTAVPTS